MAQKILTRNFLLMCSAQFAFLAAFNALMPTIPIYLSRLGSKEAQIGVLVGVLTVSSLIIRPFVGRALIRIPEIIFLIAGNLITTICCITYLFAQPFLPFFALRALQGIGFACFLTASFTLIVNMTPKAHRVQSVSYFYLANNLATALAPAFGILLINEFNFTVLFLACAGLSLLSLLLTLKLGTVKGVPLETRSEEHRPILNRAALPPSIMALISNNVWGAITTFFPLFALSHGVTNPGIFFTIFAAVLMLGRSLGGKMVENRSKERFIALSIGIQILAMITLAFSTTMPMFILVAVLWGMSAALLFPLLMVSAIERDRTSDGAGAVIGTFTALADLGMGMGAVIMGIIVQWTSYRTMFLFLAFTGFLNLVYLNLFMKKKMVE